MSSAKPARSATENTGEDASDHLSKIEDAHVAIGVLLRAVTFITEYAADYLRREPGADRYSSLPHLDSAFGLTAIAEEYLERADAARVAADQAVYDAQKVSA